MKKILYGIFLATIAFASYAHEGKPVQEAVKVKVVQDGATIRNDTGHTLILRSITCNNARDLSIHKMNKVFGKTHKQRLNTVSIQDGQSLSIMPVRYQIKDIHQCRSLRFNFGPAGSLTIKN